VDDLLRLPTIAHTRAYGTHAALQGRSADRQATPDLLAQLLLGDDPIAMRYEVAEYLEDLGRQQRTLTSLVERMELRVEDTVCEAV
jgi:hypothetical protein